MHRSTILFALAFTLLCTFAEARGLPYQEQRSLSGMKVELLKRLLASTDKDTEEYELLLERLFTTCSCIHVATQPGGSSTCLAGGCPAGCGTNYDPATGVCSTTPASKGAASSKKTREFDIFEDLFNY